MINNKGNLYAQMKVGEENPFSNAEHYNRNWKQNFNGRRMEAVWQLLTSITIPKRTNGSEGWELTQTELHHLQTIMNKALNTLLFLQKNALQETGYLPRERVIKRKDWCRPTEYSTKADGHSISQWQQTWTACGRLEHKQKPGRIQHIRRKPLHKGTGPE